MNLFCVYQNPEVKKKGENFIHVGCFYGENKEHVYIDEYLNVYVASGEIRFDLEGRYLKIGDVWLTYRDRSTQKPSIIGSVKIEYGKYSNRIFKINDMDVDYRSDGRIYKIGNDIVSFSTTWPELISIIGGWPYRPYEGPWKRRN